MSIEIIEIETEQIPVIEIVSEGIQGPMGPPGGSAIYQDYEPPIAPIGSMWFNNITKVLSISDGTQWVQDISDAGYF